MTQDATFNPDVEQSADAFSVFSTDELLSLGLIDESAMDSLFADNWVESETVEIEQAA